MRNFGSQEVDAVVSLSLHPVVVIILSSLLICDKPLAIHKPLQLNPNSAYSCSFYTTFINVLEIKVGSCTVEARNGA